MLVVAQGSYHTTVRLAYFIVSTGGEPVPDQGLPSSLVRSVIFEKTD